MQRLLLFTLIALFFWGNAAQAAPEVLTKIAAVVNDDIVTTHQLETELNNLIALQGFEKSGAAAGLQQLRRQVLDGLIEEALVHQRIRMLGLTVSDQELEAAIEDVLQQNQITHEQLRQALAQEGLDYDTYREQLRKQIMRFKLIGQEVQSKVEVSTQEVLDFFRQNIDDYRGAPTITLSYVAFSLPTDAWGSRSQTQQKAFDALAELRSGTELPALLLRYATERAVHGGELGTFTELELSGAFARAVEGLAAGHYSDVVETADGLYILRVDERNPGPIRNFDTVKEEIYRALLEKSREERFREWSAGLKKDAFIDVRI